NGGFVLKKSPSSITLYDIVSVTESSLNIFECKKYIGNNCSFGNILDSINTKFIETLKSITLEDILKTNNIDITNFVI
ncbi:MAG: Rrf2 family transcriptional regulator, partial [Calditerrivibrio sp.]|nr:Rrf2 family transcriptional regulator [Calditerrivibrio sp.]